VDDIKESVQKATTAGGEVLGEPMAIPGVGQYVSFRDTEGNRVSMLQPLPARLARARSVREKKATSSTARESQCRATPANC